MLTGINVDFEEVDLLAVGGGKAGKSLAMDLARAGQKVAMIGGTCINAACIPTKTLINSGRLLQSARRAPGAGVRNRRRRNRGRSESRAFGIVGVGDPQIDVDLLRRRKEDVVGTMVKGRLASVLDSGMDFLLGEAKFVGPRTVEVTLNGGGTRILRGADVVVNLGRAVPARHRGARGVQDPDPIPFS